jgi:hypothetical protein
MLIEVPDMPEKKKAPVTPAQRAVDVLLFFLAAGGLVLSGWSLSTLLMGSGAPLAVAVFGVAVFDLVALAAGLMVHQRRTEPYKAVGARVVMMLALAGSATVNGAHGMALGGWTSAVVFAFAPVGFEIVFEVRHRTLTALIWFLFRREAMAALRRDAWARIAPLTVQPAGQPDAGTFTVDRPHQEASASVPAVKSGKPADARRAIAGKTPGAIAPQVNKGGVPDFALKLPAAITAPVPVAPVAPVTLPAAPKPVATVPPEPAAVAVPVSKHMSKGAPVTIAQAVRDHRAAGVTDRNELLTVVAAATGGKPDSIRREIGRQLPAARSKTTGTGQYL